MRALNRTIGFSLLGIALLGLVSLVPATWLADRVTAPVLAQGYSNTNPYAYWVPPGACNSTVSGNSTGTNGLTTTGASTMPVVQTQTSATGTNTATFICNISPPNAIITTGNGILITDAVFFYSNSKGLAAQSATLASGTLNGSTLFSYVAYPTPASGETPSTVTPVRADSGTLTITPTVATFNIATITAGSFYSVRFTPATSVLVWKTDLRQLLLTVTIQQSALSATIITSSGVLVHFRGQ